jgi:hypothetical protein
MRWAMQKSRGNRIERIGLNHIYRNFLTRSYPAMKKANPSIPIMIREASGTQPTVYARFGALHPGRTHGGIMLIIWDRLWKGEEVVTKGSGRQVH